MRASFCITVLWTLLPIRVDNIFSIENCSIEKPIFLCVCAFFWFFFFFFLWLHHWYMEVPRPGVESELQLPAYTTVIMPDPSCLCNLHHSSQQCWILNPLSEARDQTHILITTSQVHRHWATKELQESCFWWKVKLSIYFLTF